MKKRSQKNFQKWAPREVISDTKKLIEDQVDTNISDGKHFATRERINDAVRLMRSLPDTDPVLRKMGKGIPALRELLTDSHLASVWSVRCSTISGAAWFVGSGGEGAKEKAAAESFSNELKPIDIPRVIEEMMGAVAYGYSPIEIIWENHDGRWGFSNLVGKPPEWFQFNQENRLVFRTGIIGQETLPENRFLLVQHQASYAQPYGSKVFSQCFWPVTFKRKGWQWWSVFVEKYGGAFMYGKYPDNADGQLKEDLLDALERMASDSVAVAPEGSTIEIISVADKGGSTTLHDQYIKAANSEISKAVLGQTLTTEIGDKGSYAAAQAHNLVREDLAIADRRRISAAFNRLAEVYTFYNFGVEVSPPKFEFVQDEDLQNERTERDAKLYNIGWRPRKSYIIREYGIPEEDFDLLMQEKNSKSVGFTETYKVPCTCGNHTAGGFLKRITTLFASKEEKEAIKNERLMQEFSDQMIEAGQEQIDTAIESYVDALGTVTNYNDAKMILNKQYKHRLFAPLAHLIDQIRYAAIGIGNHQKGGVHG
jgi:phage gp29-like protein